MKIFKFLSFFVFLSIPFLSLSASPISIEDIKMSDDRKIIIQRVENVEGATANKIHDAIVKWIGVSCDSSESVVKSDSQSCIVFYGYGPKQKDVATWKLLITFDIKDGKYRWSMTDLALTSPLIRSLYGDDLFIENMPLYKDSTPEEFVKSCNDNFSSYIDSFVKNIEEFAKDNW